ncbi:MAG TPA: hypothetical protein VGJ35_09470, partial [Burkholderiaceae bacterium]
ALMEAEVAAAGARQLVDARQRAIAQGRVRLVNLAHGWSAADALPRWAGSVTAHRDALAERLERDEYALIDEEQALEQALDLAQQRRAALASAMARQEAVQALVEHQRKADRLGLERRAEREQDDAWRPGAAA